MGRTMGKATFLSLRDRTGDLQAFLKKDKVGEAPYQALKLLDLGDIAWVRGRAMRTRTGELSIEAGPGGFRILTKALPPERSAKLIADVARKLEESPK